MFTAWVDGSSVFLDTGPSGLRDVQHALALEQGVESWTALRSRSQETALTELLAAADSGDLSQVIALLDRHPHIINLRGVLPGHTGLRTALHFGIGHEAIVRALVDRGADPNIRDQGDHAMPLHFAAENQDLAIIRLLVEHGADPIGAGDGHELEIIGWACCWDYREASTEVVDYLLAHGARHHIFSAVAMGEVAIVRALVAGTRATLDRRMDATNRRRTPLCGAIRRLSPARFASTQHASRRRHRLRRSRLPSSATRWRRPACCAPMPGSATARRPMCQQAAWADACLRLDREAVSAHLRDHPEYLRSPQAMFAAAGRDRADVVELLLDLGVSIEIEGRGKQRPLHEAAAKGALRVAKLLIDRGADIDPRDAEFGSTPIGWASYADHTAMVELLSHYSHNIVAAPTNVRPAAR